MAQHTSNDSDPRNKPPAPGRDEDGASDGFDEGERDALRRADASDEYHACSDDDDQSAHGYWPEDWE